MIIDGLQYCKWSREIFCAWRAADIACVHATVAFWENCRETTANISEFKRLLAKNSDVVSQARTADEVKKIYGDGKTAIIFGFQNCSPVENDLGLIEVFHDLGARFMQLSYNNQTAMASGCYEENDGGLSRFGRQAVREMNRAGMVADMSHSGERSTLQAIEYSQRPVAITHANPAAWSPGKRNKSDKVLDALFSGGGFLGFSLYPLHLRMRGDCTLQSFCEMIYRVAEKYGCDNIGFGSDLCAGHGAEVLFWMRNGRWTTDEDFGEGGGERRWPAAPQWFRGVDGFANIKKELTAAGFGEAAIKKIMGENWLDFFQHSFSPQ